MSNTNYHNNQDQPGSIELFSGNRFTPLEPDVDAVDITDIAHSLSRNCRYNGHVPGFYSVAEHSILMSYAVIDFVPDDEQAETSMWALLHDATEAYMPDMPRPIKGLLNGFDEAEEQLLRTIAEAFRLSWPMPDIVEKMDNIILADEARQLMTSGGEDWHLPEEGIGIEVYGWNYEFAEAQFLRRYWTLKKRRES